MTETGEAPTPGRFKRAALVANLKAGSTQDGAEERVSEILQARGITLISPTAPPEGDLAIRVKAALAEKPDVLIVLGGDGTARCAAEAAGADGPPLALLPGGTLNLLPKALYPDLTWPKALEAALDRGEIRSLAGGKANDELFFIAAIFGSAALFATAREAVREHRLAAAAARARLAFRRAFSRRLRILVSAGDAVSMEQTEAAYVICPLFSDIDSPTTLEWASLDPADALAAFRLGVGMLTGGWRNDPAARLRPCTNAIIHAQHGIPAILDGEPKMLESPVRIEAAPRGARVLSLENSAPA